MDGHDLNETGSSGILGRHAGLQMEEISDNRSGGYRHE